MEDDLENRKLAEHLLKNLGLTCEGAGNGVEALAGLACGRTAKLAPPIGAQAMLKNVPSLLLVVLIGGGGYLAWRTLHEKDLLLQQKEVELQRRSEVISRLNASTRIAQAIVVKRWTDGQDPATAQVKTKVKFVELDKDGKPLPPKFAVVDGEEVYFDALVLKFDRGLVGEGDPLKGRSVLLFRRIFGERQRPVDGTALDEGEKNGVPSPYRAVAAVSPEEAVLWRQFWSFANDPELAKQNGVRIAQGEAPHVRMESNKIYELTLDHDGGLNVAATNVPAILVDEER